MYFLSVGVNGYSTRDYTPHGSNLPIARMALVISLRNIMRPRWNWHACFKRSPTWRPDFYHRNCSSYIPDYHSCSQSHVAWGAFQVSVHRYWHRPTSSNEHIYLFATEFPVLQDPASTPELGIKVGPRRLIDSFVVILLLLKFVGFFLLRLF